MLHTLRCHVRALMITVMLAPVTVVMSTPALASGPDGLDTATVAMRPVGGQLREAGVRLPARPAMRTLRTGPVSMVAATWKGAQNPVVEVSARRGATWTRWRVLPLLQDGPTPGRGESSGQRGTDLVWITKTDQMRVRTSGDVPDNLELVLVDTTRVSRAGASHVEKRRVVSSALAVAKRKPDSAPQPRIRSRAKWGAKEKWRDGDPVHNRRMRQIHLHHTVNGNDYSRGDVAGMIAGIYRYHTKSLGWSDIGYNVLVDRFGRAWSGRFNGPYSRVRGAHTLGFNHNSTGVAVIGDYSERRPNFAVVRVIARIAAWQLDRHGRNAVGKVRMTSHGSDRYAAGKRVWLPVIDGHRHTNHTACPGDGLMKLLPKIRARAQHRIDRF